MPLKILGKLSTVGSASNCWMQGIKRCLEQLMTHHGLRSVKNSHGNAKQYSRMC